MVQGRGVEVKEKERRQNIVKPIYDAIERMGLEQIEGEPAYKSQFNVPYMTWRQGAVHDEGAHAAGYDNAEALIAEAINFIREAYYEGAKRVVWRKRPEYRQDSRFKSGKHWLRMRLHF